MDSVDKLRELADKLDEAASRMSEHGFSPIGLKTKMVCDEIEAEIKERYMKLPVDADGVPIRVGDKMDKGEVFAVAENPGDGAVWFTCNSGFNEGEYRCEAFMGYCHRHVKPRTLEGVLCDLFERKMSVTDAEREIGELLEVGE